MINFEKSTLRSNDEIDVNGFTFSKVAIEDYHVVIVCLHAQGIQEFTAKYMLLCHEYNPLNSILIGTCASTKVDRGKVIVGTRAVNYEEGKMSNEFTSDLRIQECRDVFIKTYFSEGGRVIFGSLISGSSVRLDLENVMEHWTEPRDIKGLDMEASGFLEVHKILKTNALGFFKGVVDSGDSRKDDTYHASVMVEIYKLLFYKISTFIAHLDYSKVTPKFDGENIAEQYFSNFLKHLINETDSVIHVYRVEENKIKSILYDSMSNTVRKLNLLNVEFKGTTRTWRVYKKEQCEDVFDIPTCLNVIVSDPYRTVNYNKFWLRLKKLLFINDMTERVKAFDSDSTFSL